MKANYFTKSGASVGGSLNFLDDKMMFISHQLNFTREDVDVHYNEILGIELEVIFGPIIRIILKNGSSVAFSVFDRAKMEELLTQKIS